MTIADTSVWIEFFRGREPVLGRLIELLDRQEVLALEWIFGELLQGARGSKERAIILGYWRNLPRAGGPEEEIWIRAGVLSAEKSLSNRGIGLIDAAILVAAEDSGASIWTLDQKLLKALPAGRVFRP